MTAQYVILPALEPFRISCLVILNFLRISNFVLSALFLRKQGEINVF
jgi:hypothetical protein